MRRVVVSAVGLVVLASVPALAAPGENESRSSTPVRQVVRSVVVDLDRGDVIVRHGRVGAVDVLKRWTTTQEPSFSVKVNDGVLSVTGSCPDLFGGPVVSVGGSAIGECSTSVVVTLPSTALDTTVDTNGAITLTRFRGNHDLNTGLGSITVSGTSGSALRLDSSSGAVSAKDITTGTLRANTGSGNVVVDRATATGAVTLSTSSGHVSSAGLRAASFSASSGSGNLQLTHARLRGAAALDTSSGDVQANDVHASSLKTSSGSGNLAAVDVIVRTPLVFSTSSGTVLVRHSTVPNVELSSGSGNITVLDTPTRTVKVRTSSGDVLVQRSPARTYDASTGSGHVTLNTTSTPDSVTAATSSGDVSVTVPRGAYALTLSQSSGQLAIDGITPDRRSARRLDLSTGSGDITVLGR